MYDSEQVRRTTDELNLLRKRLGKRFNMFLRLYSDYKRSARRRGKFFRLLPLEFYDLTQGNCHYCGISPQQVKEYRIRLNELPFIYNGIDRMNNFVGYEVINCVSCCWKCNRAKGDLPYEFFLKLKRG